MNDLRTAAQQALEFLDAEFGWSPGEAPRIDALRAALAQQAEPLNLSDPAVQKRLAAQWGYVHEAQQAEPVEPVATLTAQRDALLGALNDIANTDPVDAALDPQRAVRIARAAIRARTP